ncbi:hypothetical protein [Microbacterium pumilum]|uniref:Uncharacterized protein n=1 Tax=Microbacterium pumilum TaxID=344165 RepID=A0ABN2S7G3_9MICO
MSEYVPVVTASYAYRVAVAELPLRTRLSDDPAGAVVVVDGGSEWCDKVSDSLAAGARAIIVARPSTASADELAALVARAGDRAIVLERPFLRPDAVTDAVTARRAADAQARARLVAADCAAASNDFAAALRDSIGWLRGLSGGALVLRTGGNGVGLFDSREADGVPAVLTAVRAGGTSRLRIRALGEAVSEVDVSIARALVTTSTAGGRSTAPERFETPQRLALRRAIDAMTADAQIEDVAEFAADSTLAAAVIAPRGA